MKPFIVAVLAVLVTSTVYAQAQGLERGSVGAARAAAANNARLAAAAQSWRASTKITVMKETPDAPRRQGECLSVDELKSDSVGYLEYWQFEVLQVVGPTDVILMMRNPRIPPIWIAGYPTKELVDGEQVRLVGLIKVDGTKSYTTVTGAKKTLRVVRLVPAKELAAMEVAKVKATEAAAKAAEDKLFRTWASSNGKFSIEAKFVDYKSGKVFLQRRDGTTLEVSLSQLSDADREHCRDIVKSRRNNDEK